MKKWILCASLLCSSWGFTQTLVVSDIDDTIKLANVKDLTEAARYAFDDESQFTGMSELYNAVSRFDLKIHFYYLTKAPHWLMARTHQSFLQKNNFPPGVYLPRSEYSTETHKLETLRILLKKENPRRVIFFGDNGEQDVQVYAQIAKEFSDQNIEFIQFIRIVYATSDFGGKGARLLADQWGFVTPLEVALVLEQMNSLAPIQVQSLIEDVGQNIILQKTHSSKGDVTFPYFMTCRDFVWKWDESLSRSATLSKLKMRLVDRCHILP